MDTFGLLDFPVMRPLSLLLVALTVPLAQAGSLQEGWVIGPFARPVTHPVIAPDPKSTFVDPNHHETVHWEALHTFNPAAVVRDGKVMVLYRAEDDSGHMQIGMHTSRLGLASSSDGIHFTRMPEPVFFPGNDKENAREWPGGVEDPRIVQAPDGSYVLTYTQWNRVSYSIGIATSTDLLHWTKTGPAFLGAAGGKYDQLRYKSGGILTELHGDHLEAKRLHGVYWMYWGEGVVHLATSSDLRHWTPVEDADGRALEVLKKRPGHFDSGFPEVGPPPIWTKDGIVLIYNGKNDPVNGDKSLGPNAYAAGEARFDADVPAKLLEQRDKPVLQPEEAYEKTGQYVAGTTFAEGLVRFSGRWFLYYGCADSSVAVVATAGK
jgi:predicted GH43/DUF377 family glycosyl hydrolase